MQLTKKDVQSILHNTHNKYTLWVQSPGDPEAFHSEWKITFSNKQNTQFWQLVCLCYGDKELKEWYENTLVEVQRRTWQTIEYTYEPIVSLNRVDLQDLDFLMTSTDLNLGVQLSPERFKHLQQKLKKLQEDFK
jgi:hypothetical protein